MLSVKFTHFKRKLLQKTLPSIPRIVGIIGLLGLTGCLVSPEARIADKDYQTTQQALKPIQGDLLLAETPEQKTLAVHVKDRPWLGLKAIPLPKGIALPDRLRTGNGISLPFEVTLQPMEIANRITAATGIAVTLKGRPETASTVPFTPVSNITTTNSDNLVWQGPLDTLLDLWTDAYGYDWEYDGENITVIRYGASVFTINALAGVDEFKTSQSSSAQAEGTNALASQTLSTSFSFDVFKELEEQAKELVGPGTQIKASPTNGTMTVRGLPADIRTVGKFLELQNKKILRTVTLSVRIIDIQRTQSADYNLDLNVLLRDIFGKQSLQFITGGTSNLIGTLRPGPSNPTGNTVNAAIQALNLIGTITRNLDGTVAALNGQPVPLQRIVRRAYLKSSTTTTTDGVVARSFQIGYVDSGYFISFLPRIVGDDQVRVRMNIGMQNLLQLRELTSDGITLQFPEESSNAIRIERLIRSGDTLIISGTTDNKTNGNRSGLGHANNWLFGGNQDADITRNQQIILLTAEIDPPQGITEYKADLL